LPAWFSQRPLLWSTRTLATTTPPMSEPWQARAAHSRLRPTTAIRPDRRRAANV